MPNNMPIDESDGQGDSRQGTVKCPQCGNMVSRVFPYCEHCTFPIGEMLQRGSDPDFVANELKEEKRQRSQGRRSAFDGLRLSRGTAVRAACVFVALSLAGVGIYVLNGVITRPASPLADGESTAPAATTRPVVPDNGETGHGPGASKGGSESPDAGTRPPSSWVSGGGAKPRPAPAVESPIPQPSPPEKPSPSTSTPVVQKWVRSKGWYEEQCQKMHNGMVTLCSGGYLFDRHDAEAVVSQMKTLRDAVSADDASGSDAAYEELARRFNSFSASCRWQQGLRHPKIQHVVSSGRRGVWEAEDGYEFVNPGTSDLTVREKVQQLSHPPDWYFRECDVISRNVLKAQTEPYYYDSVLANQVQAKARQLRSKIYSEKANVVDRLCLELQQAYREFKSTCRWRSGVRHPSIEHVFSAERENTWNAESGWEFVHPGTSDLSVRKVVPAQRKTATAQKCTKCRGSGRVTVKYRCLRCGGSGRIKNPAAEVGQVVKDVAGVFGGRNARRIRNVPTGPAYIMCPDCDGRRCQFKEAVCDKCSGTGQKYR